MQDVAIFWDYENCSPPSNASGYIVANNIRLIAQTYGSIKSFKAYLEITDVSSARALALRSEFQSSGVSLIDCPHNGRKEVADKMIIVDMLAYAIDNPAPSVLVLISGDRDFAYALSILRLRQYQVILVTLSNAHPSLTSQASACVDWHSEIINPVVQPPSRTVNNPPGSLNRTAPGYRDSPPGQSSPSPSSQCTQETEPVGHTDHGDLLHYLRASTSSRPRRTSEASFNTGNGQPARYERPRQDVSPPIEVELRYVCPGFVSKPTTELKTSASNDSSPSIHAILDSVQERSLTLACGTKDAIVDPTDTQPSFFSLSVNHEQQFSTPLPKIDSPAPTLLPSIMQETPQHSPAAQYTVLETDIPEEDSTDLPFTYPVRPSSAPHSLPSQSPLVPLISDSDPLASETPGTPSGPPKAEPLLILLDNSASQQHTPTSEETPGKPISPVVNSTSLHDAMSEEIPNRPDIDIPGIDPIDQQSPSATNSNKDNQPSIVAAVNQASPSITGPPKPIERLPPITPIMSYTNLPETSTLSIQNTVDEPSPIIPSVAPSTSVPEIVVPPIFKILVDILRIERSKSYTKGYTNPLRTWVADALYKSGFKYETTGVSKFSQYAALAEKQGIVELGCYKTEAWISLKPEYQDPPPAPVVPPIFKILVETLKLNKSNGIPRPSRSTIAIAISRNGLTYKEAGVKKFAQYASLAEQSGIIELGGREGDAWISLKPEYQNASTT